MLTEEQVKEAASTGAEVSWIVNIGNEAVIQTGTILNWIDWNVKVRRPPNKHSRHSVVTWMHRDLLHLGKLQRIDEMQLEETLEYEGACLLAYDLDTLEY